MSYDAGVLVTFSGKGVHDEDIDKTIAVIKQLWCVEEVEPIPADIEHHMAVSRAKLELRQKIADVLWDDE